MFVIFEQRKLMDEFPANNLTGGAAPKQPRVEEEKKVERVTTGEVIVKKPTLTRRVKNSFFGADGKSVASHVFHENVIPAGKDMLFDAAIDLLARVLGVENRGVRRATAGQTAYNTISTLASKVQYNRPGYLQSMQEPKKPQTVTTRGRVSIDDIILATRVEAEEVIGSMDLLIQRFGRVTVADLFDLVGVSGEFTDEKFGWTSMQGARPHRVGQGYLLDLPPLQQLD
jgi:hypothetical protein